MNNTQRRVLLTFLSAVLLVASANVVFGGVGSVAGKPAGEVAGGEHVTALPGVYMFEAMTPILVASRYYPGGKVEWRVIDLKAVTLEAAEGTWSIGGGEVLVQTIVKSKSKLLPSGAATRDKITSLTDKGLKLTGANGKVEMHQRVDDRVWSDISLAAVQRMGAGYARSAKAAEATQELDKIHKAAVAYFAQSGQGPGGRSLPCAFPSSTKLTPADTCCSGPKQLCQPTDTLWSQRGWRELGYQPTSPGRYRFSLASEGEGDGASLVATANGDLDCDGIYSTFQVAIRGRVDGKGRCNAEGSAAIFRDNETE